MEKKILAFMQNVLSVEANPKRAEHDKGYVKSALATLGCPIPHVRKVTKDMQKTFDLSHAEWRTVLHRIYKHAKNHEVMSICLFYFKDKNLTLADWRTLKTWANRIDNWAHSDTLSELYSRLLESYKTELLPTLKEWNTHKHPWKRRLSLTSLYYYTNLRKKTLPASTVLPMVKKRIKDEHFYVQRAVGWTLRECSQVDCVKTMAFIEKHLTEFSSIAFTTACEKLPKPKKEKWKKLRKKRKN